MYITQTVNHQLYKSKKKFRNSSHMLLKFFFNDPKVIAHSFPWKFTKNGICLVVQFQDCVDTKCHAKLNVHVIYIYEHLFHTVSYFGVTPKIPLVFQMPKRAIRLISGGSSMNTVRNLANNCKVFNFLHCLFLSLIFLKFKSYNFPIGNVVQNHFQAKLKYMINSQFIELPFL